MVKVACTTTYKRADMPRGGRQIGTLLSGVCSVYAALSATTRSGSVKTHKERGLFLLRVLVHAETCMTCIFGNTS